VIIEQNHFNNSLAGYLRCPNSAKDRSGTAAAQIWLGNYLQNGMLCSYHPTAVYDI